MMQATGESWLADIGLLTMAGGSITTVNLKHVPLEDVRMLLASHFQPNGCQSVKELTEWANAQKEITEDMRTLLDTLMKELFEVTSENAGSGAVLVNDEMIRYIQIREELGKVINCGELQLEEVGAVSCTDAFKFQVSFVNNGRGKAAGRANGPGAAVKPHGNLKPDPTASH